MNFFFLFLFSISFNVEATPDCPPPQACENVGRVNLTGRGLEKIIDSSIRSSIEGIKKDLLDNPSIDKEGLSAKSAGLAGSLRNIKLQDVEIKYKGIKLVDPENLKYEVEFEFPEILLASQLSMKPILKEDYNDFLIKLREVNGKSPKIKFQLQLDPITGKIAELARVNSTKVSVPEGSITFPENKEVEKNLTSKQKNTLKSFRGLATDLSGYQEVVDGILGEMSGSFENLQNKVNLTLANLSEYTKSYEQVQLPDLNVADLKTKGTELTDGHRSTKSLISEVRVDIKTAQEKNQQNWEKHLQKVMSSIDKALTGNVQQAIHVSDGLRRNPVSVKAVKDPGLEQFLQGFNLTKSDVGSDLVADLYEDVLKLQQEYSSYLRSLEKQGVPVYSNPRVTEIDIKFDEALEKLKKQYEALQQRADDQDQQQTVQSLFNKIDGVNKGVVAIPMYTPELPCPPNGRFVLANEKIRGDYDFSTVVGVDYLNHYLETSRKRGNFAFCAEFARVEVNGQGPKCTREIKVNKPLQLFWDGKNYRAIIDGINVKDMGLIDVEGELQTQFTVHPRSCQDGKVCFHFENIESKVKQGGVFKALESLSKVELPFVGAIVSAPSSGLSQAISEASQAIEHEGIDFIPGTEVTDIVPHGDLLELRWAIKDEPDFYKQ